MLNYTVINSLEQSAVPLQLEVVIYESASVQASLLLISQVASSTTARAEAHANTARLTDAAASATNYAFRYMIPGSSVPYL